MNSTQLFLLFIGLSVPRISYTNRYVHAQENNLQWVPAQPTNFFSSFMSKKPPTASLEGIDGMIGSMPLRLQWIIQQLNASSCNVLNRLILHGPPGNGKSTLARKIAELSNAEYLGINTPAIADKYIGVAAQRISAIFDDAQNIYAQTGKRVIIFFDEIDSIATHNDSEIKSQHTDALQTLWLKLDEIKNNPYIYVICATNNVKEMHPTFIDRFGTNIIEITYPTLTDRIKLFDYFFMQHNIICSEHIIYQLASQLHEVSIRSIEDLANTIVMIAQVNNKGMVTHELIKEQCALMKKKKSIFKTVDVEKKMQFTQTTLNIAATTIGLSIMMYQLFCFIRNSKI